MATFMTDVYSKQWPFTLYICISLVVWRSFEENIVAFLDSCIFTNTVFDILLGMMWLDCQRVKYYVSIRLLPKVWQQITKQILIYVIWILGRSIGPPCHITQAAAFRWKHCNIQAVGHWSLVCCCTHSVHSLVHSGKSVLHSLGLLAVILSYNCRMLLCYQY